MELIIAAPHAVVPWGSGGCQRHSLPRAHNPRQQPRRRLYTRCHAAVSHEAAVAVPNAAEAAALPPLGTAGTSLPFFPDQRCVEALQLPPLQHCHHYINLTNGIEAVPRLQLLGLPYRFLRLPSTRCEQQQFEQLLNDLDSDLLMRLALGQCCLVYDFGSRNKKRGAPRAVWYGLEFIRFALRRLWLGQYQAGPAYLRGYSVANVFEGHVAALSNSTKKKLRYYKRYIGPQGLPHLHLYGVYAATANDGNQQLYTALLRHCEGAGEGTPTSQAAAYGESSASAQQQHLPVAAEAGAAAEAAQRQQQEHERQQQQVQAAIQAAAASLQGIDPGQRQALLLGDPHAAAETLLGMRLFLGGISHRQYHSWAERVGYLQDGKAPAVDL